MGSIIFWARSCATDAVPPSRLEQELGRGAGDSTSTLREGYRGIVDAHQLMVTNGTPGLTSI